MRLIDADALIKDLRELLYTDENPSKQLTDAGQAIHNAAIALAASEVTDAPTIDAAPVVHARWVHEQRYGDSGGWVWRCTACRGEAISPIISALQYCHRCGAKMDEKEDDDAAD